LIYQGEQMIVQSKESKPSSSLIDFLSSNPKTKNGKTNDTFSQLLASLNTPAKETTKEAKEFAVVVDPKNSKKTDITKIDSSTVKKPAIGSIASEEIFKADETKMLPKELVDTLSNDQIKNLIHRARDYLKSSIEQKAPEYKLEGKEMPKTLLGLVELADKIGIDLSQITLSTLDDAQKPLFKDLPLALVQKSLVELKELQLPDDIKNKKLFSGLLGDAIATESELVSHKEGEKTSQSQPLQSILRATEPATKNVQQAVQSEKTSQSQPLQYLLSATEPATKNVQQAVQSEKTPLSHSLQSLLKSTDTVLPTEATSTIEPKGSTKPLSSPSVETLSNLLKGDIEDEKEGGGEKIKSLDEPTKGLHSSKTDSLEVKTKEATQGLKAFAINLKEAAESYKPPFTRVTMKLNPERLGEVDVTLVQRGNNVHVTIQSNNTASVAFLAHNAQELKAQLAHQGVTGATMSFMTGGDGQPHNPQQQQHNRFAAYKSLQELEAAQQELSALEIILPHYA
jgi:flagellar hook-length control protein FliK